jgi:ankyrin repeat protein
MKTLAHWARTDNVEQIEALLAAGADPNAEENATHWSPLVEAVYGNHAEAAFLLLEAGADMYAPTRSGTTPLTLAFQQGSIAVVELLRSYGYHPDPLRDDAFTLWNGTEYHPGLMEWLASEGVDVNATEERGWTALMWACYYGNVEFAAALLRFGADPNHAGESALRHALFSVDYFDAEERLLDLLIEAGADIVPVLKDAVTKGQVEVVELWLAHHADVNATDAQGHRCLFYAHLLTEEVSSKAEILRLLDQQGATLNQKDREALAKHPAQGQ